MRGRAKNLGKWGAALEQWGFLLAERGIKSIPQTLRVWGVLLIGFYAL
jgi:hypothetical protein